MGGKEGAHGEFGGKGCGTSSLDSHVLLSCIYIPTEMFFPFPISERTTVRRSQIQLNKRKNTPDTQVLNRNV